MLKYSNALSQYVEHRHLARRVSALFVAALTLGFVGWRAVIAVSSTLVGPEPSHHVTTATVKRGDVVQAVHSVGQLVPASSVEVSSQISGLVTSVAVDFNSEVRKGQILATIDSSTYQQRLRQAKADLESTNAAFEVIALRANRLKELRDHGLVSQQDYDDIEAQLRGSQSALVTRQAAVDNARMDVDRCTIVSPIDGIVIFKQAEVGKTVAASLSAPTLFVIAESLATMRIIAPVSEVDIRWIRVGQPVTFSVEALPGRRFSGRLSQIRNPYVASEKAQDFKTSSAAIATFDAIIEIDNRDLLLRPGISSVVMIIVAERRNALIVPNSAIRRPSKASTTSESLDLAHDVDADMEASVEQMTSDERPGNHIATTPIVIGLTDSFVSEVVSGLEEGDKVVIGETVAAD